jgi:membrane associated rhomboid family serine protease
MRNAKLFIYSLTAVLTGVLAILDARTAAVFGCFCLVLAFVLVDQTEQQPTVHERVRASRAKRRR